MTYGLGWFNNRLTEPIPCRWLHVLNWGGLRGAIALALALSLPAALGPDRESMRVMAFGVVLFTLLVQSTTMRPLLRRLGISTRNPIQVEYETRHARMVAFARLRCIWTICTARCSLAAGLGDSAARALGRTEQMALDVRALQRAHPELAADDWTAPGESYCAQSGARCAAYSAMV